MFSFTPLKDSLINYALIMKVLIKLALICFFALLFPSSFGTKARSRSGFIFTFAKVFLFIKRGPHEVSTRRLHLRTHMDYCSKGCLSPRTHACY